MRSSQCISLDTSICAQFIAYIRCLNVSLALYCRGATTESYMTSEWKDMISNPTTEPLYEDLTPS